MEDKLRRQLDGLEYNPSDSLWNRIDGEIGQDGFERTVRSKLDGLEEVPYPETWGKIESELPDAAPGRFRYWRPVAFAAIFASVVFAALLFNNTEPQLSASLETPLPAVVPADREPVNIRAGELPVTANEKKRLPEATSPVPETPQPENAATGADAEKEAAAEKTVGTIPPVKETHDEPEALFAPVKNIKKPAPKPSHHVLADRSNAPVNITPVPVKQDEISAPVNLVTTVKPSVPEMASGEKAAGRPVAEKTIVPVEQGGTIQEVKEVKTNEPVAGKAISSPVPAAETVMPSVAMPAADSAAKAQGNAITQAELMNGVKLFDEEDLTKISISVIVGANYCLNSLRAPSASSYNFTENIALRRSLEKPQMDWSGMFLVDYALTDRLRISAGIGVLNFNQSFYYNIATPSTVPNRSPERGAIVINSQDSIVMGNSLSTRIKYSWTEIPLLATYRFTSNERWNFELQGGVSYAVISTVDAGMVSYDNIGVLLVKDKDAFPRIQNSFFVTLNPALTFRLNRETTLGIMPNFKMSLTSLVANDQWVQQYPYFFGGALSLRRRF